MPRFGPLSLKQRLWIWLMAPLLVAVAVLGLVLQHVVSASARDWMDESLTDTALAVASLMGERGGEPHIELSEPTDQALRFDRQDRVYLAARGPNGALLKGDALLAELALPGASARRQSEPQLYDARLGADAVRVAVVWRPCGLRGRCEVRVAETSLKRDATQRQIWLVIGLAMLGLAGLLALSGWLAIGQGLRPLEALGDEVEQRNLGRLDPLDTSVPGELRGLIGAFNRLFERLRSANSAQKEFLANAAHQLRTPLTALGTEVDLALLEPHDPAVEPLLLRLQRAVTRSARLAQQMLSIARAEAQGDPDLQLLDLGELARQGAEDWLSAAHAQALDLGFELAAAPTRGTPYLLRELLENLVHNAATYAGRGARITVRTGSDPAAGHAWLEVEDNGPGIPAAQREWALQRFRRLHPAQGSGSGLGLAIAKDIAERHGGELTLGDGSQGAGLCVRLSVPLSVPQVPVLSPATVRAAAPESNSPAGPPSAHPRP